MKIRYRNVMQLLMETLLWVIGIIYLIPVYLEITIALKSQEDFATNLYGLPKQIMLTNLFTVWEKMDVPIVTFRSFILAGVPIVFTVIFASMAAYSIARRNNRLYRNAYIFIIAGMMVPFQLSMIPLYKLINSLKMMNTYQGVICIYITAGIPLAVMVFTGFIKAIPRDLDESATIDGCNKFQIYYKIIIPFLKPPIITIIIFNAVMAWNDLLTPLLFLGGGKLTIITALYNFKGAVYTTDWTMVFAGAVITMVPLVIIFLFSQKYFIKGMVAGAVKG